MKFNELHFYFIIIALFSSTLLKSQFAGAVGTVAAAGSVAGLGAAGITSGLAAVGSVVGGGMAAGLAVTAAAPVAIGAAAYGLYKWLKD